MYEDLIPVEEENLEDEINVEEENVIVNTGGTTDYRRLNNKPSINNVELLGNKSLEDLGIDQDFVKDNNYVHTDNNYTTEEKNKLSTLENYDDTEVKQDISDLETKKADKSEIPDVSNFITRSVNDLTYYTKTSDLSNVATSGSYNDLNNTPDLSVFATTEALGNETTARENAEISLQNQIDAITVSSDVVDVLGTYAELQIYDITHIKENDIVKVLQDETHNNAMSYYRWVITEGVGAWVYVGSEGPFYTKGETNDLLAGKQDELTNGYNDLSNKPQINGNTLFGNKTGADLGLPDLQQFIDTLPTGEGIKNNSYYAIPATNLFPSASGYVSGDYKTIAVVSDLTVGTKMLRLKANPETWTVFYNTDGKTAKSFTYEIYKIDSSTGSWVIDSEDTTGNGWKEAMGWGASGSTTDYSNMLFSNNRFGYINASAQGVYSYDTDDNVTDITGAIIDTSDNYFFTIYKRLNNAWINCGISDYTGLLKGKLNANQGSENAGKFLKVANDGSVIYDTVSVTVDTAMSDSSINAVQNKVIKSYVDTQIDDVIGEQLEIILGGGVNE